MDRMTSGIWGWAIKRILVFLCRGMDSSRLGAYGDRMTKNWTKMLPMAVIITVMATTRPIPALPAFVFSAKAHRRWSHVQNKWRRVAGGTYQPCGLPRYFPKQRSLLCTAKAGEIDRIPHTWRPEGLWAYTKHIKSATIDQKRPMTAMLLWKKPSSISWCAF